jgi:hypothetical protein
LITTIKSLAGNYNLIGSEEIPEMPLTDREQRNLFLMEVRLVKP